jgi:HlyD family secretion protein
MNASQPIQAVEPGGPAGADQPGKTGPAADKVAPAQPARKVDQQARKKAVSIGAVLVAVLAAIAWFLLRPAGLPTGFASGNGRIEATEIDVAAKLAGRLEEIFVLEGEFVKAGQVVARMDTEVLEAQRQEARAEFDRAKHAVDTADAMVSLRKSDKAAAVAVVAQREAELDAARRRLARSDELSKEGAETLQKLDDDRADVRSAEAAVTAARAQVASAQAAIVAAETEAIGARAKVQAVEATIERITADIDDSQLTAPRDGRVQFKVTQPGEVLGAGGKVLNLVDLTDVYMTFFLPEAIAGKLAIGAEARLVLDAAPELVVPAKVTFVADVAQYTPKTVETETERQKLMFRVRAHIPPELLRQHIELVKTGLPGIAYVRWDDQATWPEHLQANVDLKPLRP